MVGVWGDGAPGVLIGVLSSGLMRIVGEGRFWCWREFEAGRGVRVGVEAVAAFQGGRGLR